MLHSFYLTCIKKKIHLMEAKSAMISQISLRLRDLAKLEWNVGVSRANIYNECNI